MTTAHSTTIQDGSRFVALSAAVAVALALVGWVPTARLGGAPAVAAMLAGCAVSLAGSLIGTIPVILARRGPVLMVPQAVLLSTVVRFLVVLMLALAVALSGWFSKAPLLIWVAISYLMLLAADTTYAVRLMGAIEAEK